MSVLPMCGKGSMMKPDMIIPFLVIAADSICDIRKMEIFPLLTLTGMLAGIPLRLAFGSVSVIGLLLALLPGIIVMAGSVVTDGQIGRGDALAILMIGVWTDPWTSWETVLFGSFTAAAFSVLLWMFHRRNEEFPFVPFLFAGMLASSLL